MMLCNLPFIRTKETLLFKNYQIIIRSIATLRSSSILSSQIQGTFLIRPQKVTISTRFMRQLKNIFKVVGHASKLLKAPENKVLEVAALVKKTEKLQTILQQETVQSLLALSKNTLMLKKYYVLAPLIYTPKHFRFWLLEDCNRFGISGMASLTAKERNILQYRYCDSPNISLENHFYYINYTKVICLVKAQIFYYGFQYKQSLNITEMLTILQKIYSIPTAALPWLKNKAFKELYEQKAAAMIQHFLVMTYGTTEFNLRLNDPYMISDTKKGTILAVIELFTAYTACMPSILKDLNLSLRLITPEVAFLKSGDIFNSNDSLQQINQQNSDCLAYELVIEAGGVKVITYYRDVKMDYKGPLKGHISFKVLASTDFMSLKTLLNDIQTTIHRLLKDSHSSESKVILKKFLNFCEMKAKDINQNNTKEIYQDIKQYLLTLTFNKTLIKDNIHFSVIISFETNSDPVMKDIIMKIEQDPNLLQHLEPDIHYPQYSKISLISWKKYHELCLKGIKAHLPITAQESILENYISIYVNLEKQLALL